MSRRVYLDVGTGWWDVSRLVLPSSLNYTKRAASDNYHRAQNIVFFSLVYDFITFSGIYSASSDIKVKVTAFNDPTEEVIFTGIIPPTASRTYNGKLDNTILRLEGTDSSEKLNKEVGDVLYKNFTIMNPASKSTSIVHQLAYRAGFTDAQINQNTTIATAYPYFAPNNEKDKILDVLDVLLFENGYIMNMDENDAIRPLPWIVDTSTESVFDFTEDNIIKEISTEENNVEWDAVDMHYFLLLAKENVRVYTENLPYKSDGSFAGYSVPAGYFWPIEANAIDRITLTNTVVYQKYDDAGIKFLTNEAIVKKLDYNYKAFPSDFSGIVATFNHVLSVSTQALTLLLAEYGNKSSQILYKNYQTTAQDLFFLHIDASVVYKSMERVLRASSAGSPKKVENYQSYFIFNEVSADKLAKNMVQMATAGNVFYTFESLVDKEEGSFVKIVTSDGTNQVCFVVEKTFSEETGVFRYKVRGYAYNTGSLVSEVNYKIADSGVTNLGNVNTTLEDMALDGVITPQEKTMIRLRWVDIDGYVGVPGSYLQVRTSAIEAGVSSLSLDFAYGRLYDQLFTNPGVLRADFATETIIISSSFYSAWSLYFQSESQLLATISRWSSLQSVISYDCGVYDDSVEATFAPELDNGFFNVYQVDDTGEYDYGVFNSMLIHSSETDCGIYSLSILYDETIDMGEFDITTDGLYAPPDIELDCGVFTTYA